MLNAINGPFHIYHKAIIRFYKQDVFHSSMQRMLLEYTLSNLVYLHTVFEQHICHISGELLVFD
jgi:hypothetical protein